MVVVVVTGHRMTGQGAALYLPLMKNCNCFLKGEPGVQRARGVGCRRPDGRRPRPAATLPALGPRCPGMDHACS